MEATEILTQNVDKTQLPPLHQKRILAFVNHFLISSCAFLNEFALQCETKFIELERKLQKVEAALTIIEAKLDSIPDLDNKQNLIKESNIEKKPEKLQESKVSELTTEPQIANRIKGIMASEHALYKKFFKMLQVGVPAQAVKMKMQAEGIDQNILDNPNIVIPFENES